MDSSFGELFTYKLTVLNLSVLNLQVLFIVSFSLSLPVPLLLSSCPLFLSF